MHIPVSASLSGAVAQFVVSQSSSPDDCLSSAEGCVPLPVVLRPAASPRDARALLSRSPLHLQTGPLGQALSPINIATKQFIMHGVFKGDMS